MSSEWIERPLHECVAALIDYRGKTPTKTTSGIPLITAKIVKNGRIETPSEFISENDFASWMRRGIPKNGDVVITTEAPLGEVAQLGPERIALAQRLITLRGKPEILDNTFLKFLLQSEGIQDQLKSRSSGSTVSGIKQSELRKISLCLPPIEEQRAIAHILGSLDDKIALNRKRNETLEAMARALFQDWFVDFGPVRAKMEGREPYLPAEIWELFPERLDEDGKPEGWGERSVYDFANVVYGAPFSSKMFNSEGLGAPLIRIRDLSSQDPGIFTEEVNPKGHLIKPGDIVVGMDGEFRLHIWKGQHAWLNQRVCHFEPKPGASTSFLAYALIEPLAFFERGKVGTTVIHLGKADIDTIRLMHSSTQILEAFSRIAEPWITSTVQNALESNNLAQLRDTLLPRLISGEAQVWDIDKFVRGSTS